ncbi:hypothetical protein E2542_SST25541 [Spatholobus suberectus]|nr:hypothetical protein E2542_SST25541 [Spatholobus suberectus]
MSVSWKLGNLGTATTGAFQAALTTLIAAKAATECIQTEPKSELIRVYCVTKREFWKEKKKIKENWKLKMYTPSIEASLLLARLNVIIVRHLLLCWCRPRHILGVEEDDSCNGVRPYLYIYIYKLKHRKLVEHVKATKPYHPISFPFSPAIYYGS